MKRIFIGLSLATLFLSSCGSAETKETTVIEEEIVVVDSVAVEMNKASEEIEKDTEELDALLNEI